MKLKKSICDETQKLKFWQNSKTQTVTKLKNSNCEKTQKLKLGQNLLTQIVAKLKNSNCDQTKNSNCDKTQKLKWRVNLNYDNSWFLNKKLTFSRNILTPWQPMRCFLGRVLHYCNVFHIILTRRYGPLRGPTYSSCGGLWPSSADVKFSGFWYFFSLNIRCFVVDSLFCYNFRAIVIWP